MGRTLTKIAWEKAGIIKKGVKFWTAEQRPHLLKIFAKECRKYGVKFNQVLDRAKNYNDLNRELVKSAALDLGFNERSVKRGLKDLRLPARFETVQTSPRVIIDGAHNDRKMETTLENLKKQKYRKLHLVMAFAKSKDYVSMLKEFLPLAHHMVFTRFETPLRKTADPGDLMRAAQAAKFRGKLEMSLDPMVALNKALQAAHQNDLVLVTGSFFLAGRLREKWFPEEWVLKNRKSV